MVNIVLGFGRNGIQDWLLQRISAVILAAYFIFIGTFIILHPGLTFDVWYDLFTNLWIQFATFLALLSLLVHAWIGMVTITTDYIKPLFLKILVHLFVIIFLIACFVWGIVILWSI